MADGNPRAHVVDVGDINFETEVLASKVPFVLDFGARWCGPCKLLAKTVHALAAEEAGRIRVGETDIDDAPATAARYGVRAVPTVIVFRDGREVARHVGVVNKDRLRELASR